MDSSSVSSCSDDDDGSVIICISDDEGSIQDNLHTEPDSHGKMAIFSPNVQDKTQQPIEEVEIQVAASDSITSLQLDKNDKVVTDQDSFKKDKQINLVEKLSADENEVQIIEERRTVESEKDTDKVPSKKDNKINHMEITFNGENEVLIVEERRIEKDKIDTDLDSFKKDKQINLVEKLSVEDNEVQIIEERRIEQDKVDTYEDSFKKDKQVNLMEKLLSVEENEVQIIEERRIEEDNLQTKPDSCSKMSIFAPNVQDRTQQSIEEVEIQVSSSDTNTSVPLEKSEKSLHIPTKTLIKMISKKIISSPSGFAPTEGIEEGVIQRFPCCGNKARFVKKLILNTLENNSETFIPYIVKNENTFQSGFWTLHPIAAAKFITSASEGSDFKKSKRCLMEKKCAITVDDKLSKKPVVALKRLTSLDYWASKRKVAEMDTSTMIMPSSDVVNTLKRNYGIAFEMKWEGWSSCDKEQESKIAKLEKIIDSANGSLVPDISPTGQKEQTVKNKDTPIANSSSYSQLKNKGIKRIRLSASCSYLDVETLDDESIVCKEHNYVASQDSSGPKNLIESLLKIVTKLDKDRGNESEDIRTTNNNSSENESQDEEEDFLGFDNDLWSGYWRGWDKCSSKNAERLKEIIKGQEGSRDLEDVLRESDLAVTRYIEELEMFHLRSEETVQNLKPCDQDATIKNCLKELMVMYDLTMEEPPISYPVLIVMAICDCPKPAITVGEICHFIQQHFPFHSQDSLYRLNTLVKAVLRFGHPFTFQKSRRPTNPTTCWRVNSAAAYGILKRALDSARLKMQSTRGLLKNMKEDGANLPGKYVCKAQERVIGNTNPLDSLDKTSHSKQKSLINIRQIQLNEYKCNSTAKSFAKHLEINTTLNSNSKNPSKNVTVHNIENKINKDIKKSLVASSEPAILNDDSYGESTKVTPEILSASHVSSNCTVSSLNSPIKGKSKNSVISRKGSLVKQNVSPQSIIKNKGIVTPEKISGVNCTYNYSQNFIEDKELEIIDIDPCLQGKENTSLSEDDEICVIDEVTEEAHNRSNHVNERLFGNDESSKTNKGINYYAGNSNGNCSFLRRCLTLDSENKLYPCFICHKSYLNNTVLHIHLVQKHCGQENIHIPSSLCQDRHRKTKSMKETKNRVATPCENSFESEASIPRKENYLHHLQSNCSVILYSCTKCKAVFDKQDKLELHTEVFHQDASMRSLIPLKQVSTPEGKYYYCDKCSSCFHTEKALFVHTCVPFPGAQSSFT